ncbi:MAG: helix-turn-helix domain-containing protein [Clostridia bacterium]|nr:helix-turn-helix domain-containing protein [Clostridia bacterium]
MASEKLTVSVEEMAKMLGISKPVAYELIKREGFPAVRISPRRIIIPLARLSEWINSDAINSGVI